MVKVQALQQGFGASPVEGEFNHPAAGLDFVMDNAAGLKAQLGIDGIKPLQSQGLTAPGAPRCRLTMPGLGLHFGIKGADHSANTVAFTQFDRFSLPPVSTVCRLLAGKMGKIDFVGFQDPVHKGAGTF